MLEAYLYLLVAALFFSLQFLPNKRYQLQVPEGLCSSGLFLLLHSIWILLIWGTVYKFSVVFPSGEQIWYSVIYVVSSALCTVCTLAALRTCKLAVVTLFELVGGQLIPFLYSCFFTGGAEGLTWISWVGFAILLLTCVIGLPKDESGEKSKMKLSALLFCMGTFVGNGMVSVATDMSGKSGASSEGFLMLNALFSVFIGVALMLTKPKQIPVMLRASTAVEKRSGGVSAKQILILAVLSFAFAVLNGLGNVFSLRCAGMEGMQGTVQFPVLNSLIIIFTPILARIVFREKITKKILLASSCAVVGILLFMLDTLLA